MKFIAQSGLAFVIALAFASCGEPEKAKLATVRPSVTRPAGEFDEIGTITLYPGESCASQVVFIFHSGLKSISLAAPWHQSEILKEAVRSHRDVRVVGKWRRGKTPDCTYIEATQVEAIQKTFW